MIVLTPMLTMPSRSSKASVLILSRNMLKRVVESRHNYRTPNCCSEPVSYAAVGEDGTSGLDIEVFDDLNKVCADVVLLHGRSQSCMPNPVEGHLEVYEDMIEVFLVREVFLT